MISNFKSIIAIGFLVIASTTAFGAEQAKISDLSWLSGQWNSGSADASTEIYYSAPAAGTVLGMFRMINGGAVSFFEYERIAEESGTLVLYPSPNGNPGVSFMLKELSNERAVFENPAHAFPRTIKLYLDEPGNLHIRVDGEQGGQAITQELVGARN